MVNSYIMCSRFVRARGCGCVCVLSVCLSCALEDGCMYICYTVVTYGSHNTVGRFLPWARAFCIHQMCTTLTKYRRFFWRCIHHVCWAEISDVFISLPATLFIFFLYSLALLHYTILLPNVLFNFHISDLSTVVKTNRFSS